MASIPLDFVLRGGHPEWAYVIKVLKLITDHPPDSQWSLVDLNGQPVPPEGTPQAGQYVYRNDYDTLQPTYARGPEYHNRYRPFVSGWRFDESSVSHSSRSSAGQNDFRFYVACRDSQCLITGADFEDCDVCHIVPYSRPDIYVKVLKLNNPIHCEDLLNHPSNYLNHPSYGFLLRNDLHKMYDDLRMSLYYKDGSYFVHVFKLRRDNGAPTHGHEIPPERFRSDPAHRPNPALVEWHYQQCLMAYIRGFSVGMNLPRQFGEVPDVSGERDD